MSDTVLIELAATIKARRSASAEASYTRSLLDAGIARCAKKFGEEAVETVMAAVGQDDDALKGEAADALFHLLVLLESRNVADRRCPCRSAVTPRHVGSCRKGRAS